MLYEVVICTLQESDTKHTSEVNKLKHQISQLEAEKEKMSKSHTSLCIELHDIVETKKKLEDSIELYHTQVCNFCNCPMLMHMVIHYNYIERQWALFAIKVRIRTHASGSL